MLRMSNIFTGGTLKSINLHKKVNIEILRQQKKRDGISEEEEKMTIHSIKRWWRKRHLEILIIFILRNVWMMIIMSRVLGVVGWIERVRIHVRRYHEEVWRYKRKVEDWLKVTPIIELFSWGEFLTLFILLFLHFLLLLFDWKVVDLLKFNFFLPYMSFLPLV